MNNNITPLCELAYKYGTDKCPQLKHSYTPYYWELFKDKQQSVKKVLELGIGYYKTMKHEWIVYDRNLKRHYHKGASLKMWRDFFPNAEIYGADIQPDTIFEDRRITTYLCDETKKEDLVKLIEQTGSDIDIFIDDGSHHLEDQIFVCLTIIPLLKKDVIYIIEDVTRATQLVRALALYNCYVPPIPRELDRKKLVVVRNKQ